MSRAAFEMDEQLKEIALRVACDMGREYVAGWIPIGDLGEFASRFLAALPKPEPVAYMFSAPGITKLDVCPHGGEWKPLYTDPPIQSAQGWQPIETAPKGKRGYAWMRLAWGPDEDKNTGDGFYAEGKFFASACYFKLSGVPAFEYRQIEVTPTHWMPFPAAPGATPAPHPVALADDIVRDAERYQWLAGSCKSADEPYKGGWSIHIQGPVPMRHDEEDSFDEAIDAAIAAAKGGAARSADTDDWIKWKGGECPLLPETLVQIKFSDGDSEIETANTFRWHWEYDGKAGDIVAYRVVQGGAA